MHIVIINHYATTPYENGGTRHFDMARELIKAGHHVTIIASSYNHFSKKETKKYKNKIYYTEMIDGINFVWIKTIPYKSHLQRVFNIISFYINTKKFLKEHKFNYNPDIVIGSTVHLLAAQLAVELSNQYNADFYFEERDFWPQTFVDFGKISENNLIAKILYKYERYFYKKAKKIIVLFKNADDYLLSKGVDSKKIIYLPNGFSETKYDKEIDNKELEILLEENCVVYIGSHGYANNLTEVLKLCKEMNMTSNEKIKFIFIGDGLEKENLIAYSQTNALNNVYFHNPISKQEVDSVLQKANFTIISIMDSPLYKYGFSMNKIFDYLKAGKPMIMLAPQTLVEEFNTKGISVGMNNKNHIKFIEDRLNNSNLYQKDVECILSFSKKYSWNNIISQFLKDIKG